MCSPMSRDPGGSTTTTPHRAGAPPALDDVTLRDLVSQLASGEPTPGGGTAAALGGALGAALVAMVGRLTEGRTMSDADAALVTETLASATALQSELLNLATLDANAYAAVVAARRLPRSTDAERDARAVQLAQANRLATDVPLRTARSGLAVLDQAERLVAVGNPNAISDIGVAAHLALACVEGGALNVAINLPSLPADDLGRRDAEAEIEALQNRARAAVGRIVAAVASRMAEPRGAKPTPT
jgi:formiminotetrahydrofolate cyclodeaminase